MKYEPKTTPFFTDSSLQASQYGTKTQGVNKEEEKRRIEAKESDTSTTPAFETSMNDFTHHTAKQQWYYWAAEAFHNLKTEGKAGSEIIAFRMGLNIS